MSRRANARCIEKYAERNGLFLYVFNTTVLRLATTFSERFRLKSVPYHAQASVFGGINSRLSCAGSHCHRRAVGCYQDCLRGLSSLLLSVRASVRYIVCSMQRPRPNRDAGTPQLKREQLVSLRRPCKAELLQPSTPYQCAAHDSKVRWYPRGACSYKRVGVYRCESLVNFGVAQRSRWKRQTLTYSPRIGDISDGQRTYTLFSNTWGRFHNFCPVWHAQAANERMDEKALWILIQARRFPPNANPGLPTRTSHGRLPEAGREQEQVGGVDRARRIAQAE